MRVKMILTTVIAWAALAIIGTPHGAHADDFLWLGAVDNDWRNELNWFNITTYSFPDDYPHGPNADVLISSIPGRGTAVVLSAEPGCEEVQNLTIDDCRMTITGCLRVRGKLTIKTNACLTIDCGGTLELAGNNTSHKIGGFVYLACSTSTLRISGNATLNPYTPPAGNPVYGNVQGQDNAAEIVICNSKTLINNITLSGMMVIKSGSCSTAAVAAEASEHKASTDEATGAKAASNSEIATITSKAIEPSGVSRGETSGGGVTQGERVSGSFAQNPLRLCQETGLIAPIHHLSYVTYDR